MKLVPSSDIKRTGGAEPSAFTPIQADLAALKAMDPDRQRRFDAVLGRALERGARRKPYTQPVLVHAEVFQDFAPLYPGMRAFMERLASLDWKAGPPPFFLVNPIHAGALETDFFEPFSYHPDRVLTTEMRGSLGTGHVAFSVFERFLRSHDSGIHPEDRWVFHGGEWHVCLTTAALQWGMNVSTRTWWGQPSSPEEAETQDRISEWVLPAADALPVEFGEVFDPQGVSMAETRPFHWAQRVPPPSLSRARAFTRSTTRFFYLK